MLKKTVIREICGSFGRFIAIFAIIALGTGFFAGLRVARDAMVETAERYTTQLNLYDFRLLSTVGFSPASVEEIQDTAGVKRAEGANYIDFIYAAEQGTDVVLRAHTITGGLNQLDLQAGRMPRQGNECVVDARYFSERNIGDKIVVSPNNAEDTLSALAWDTYEIVGTVKTPYYMHYDRGSTSVGNGSIAAFIYIPAAGVDLDYYTEIFVSLDETGYIYSSAYDSAIETMEPAITASAQAAAEKRFAEILAEAEGEIAAGESEYDEGYAQYLKERQDAEEKIAKAKRELDEALDLLVSGQKALNDSKAEFERQMAESRAQLDGAESELAAAYAELLEGEEDYLSGREKLRIGEKEYESGKAAFDTGLAQYEAGLKEYNAGMAELDAAMAELDDAKAELDRGKAELESAAAELGAAEALYRSVSQLRAAMAAIGYTYGDNASLIAALENSAEARAAAIGILGGAAQVDNLVAAWNAAERAIGTSLDEGYLASARAALEAGQRAYEAGRAEYEEGLARLQAYADQMENAKAALEESKALLDETAAGLAAARAELDGGWAELEDARQKLDSGWAEYNAGREQAEDGLRAYFAGLSEGQRQIEEAEAELIAGEKAYRQGLSDFEAETARADREFLKAEEELREAEQKIEDARAELAAAEHPAVYVLDRYSNVGYASFENDSDIVRGISTVFPLFFFLVAALICITTMTRMVDEQRTQIGVLKAMGYSSGRIMAKYLIYSGSASLSGCVIGFLGGSLIFPKVLWQAYNIMYGFSGIAFVLDLPLAAFSISMYMVCALGATWLSCKNELSQAPAELVRPKAPKNGKRIFLEYIPLLWNRFSFLYKVSARNVFRYKKRLVMMILGVSGCTALLLTGFGLGDSIQGVVDYQYDEITLYDYAVTFKENMSEDDQAAFTESCRAEIDDILFLHESMETVEAGGVSKSVYFMVAEGDSLYAFTNLHLRGERVPLPALGEAIINDGLAEGLGVKVGDSITILDQDMREMQVTVSGIFTNYVYNYVYISQETYTEAWGEAPSVKMAFINAPENAGFNAGAAAFLGEDTVANVSISQNMRERVGQMMASVDYIVFLVVVCAGMLAFIVIYNLTNINITERIREIATIKVLGFYPLETASYVFRENIVMTAFGILLGLGLGKLLHTFVMSQIKIDLIRFDVRISGSSFVWSVLLTIVFACLVSLFMYFKLERIKMAESLKSIE